MRLRIWFRAVFAVSITICSVVNAFGQLSEKREQFCEVPIVGDGSEIIIPVTLGSQNYRFSLSTGSSVTALDATTFRSVLNPLPRDKLDSKRSATGPEQYQVPEGLKIDGKMEIAAGKVFSHDFFCSTTIQLMKELTEFWDAIP